MEYSEVEIREGNYLCEGKRERSVGSVLGNILDWNLNNNRNMVFLNCFELTCSVGISSCKPWQETECGSYFLEFEVDNERNINHESFKCIEVP